MESISITDNPYLRVEYSTLETDTVNFDEFGLVMFPVMKLYSFNQEKSKSFSFIPSAFACSPPHLISEETITDIQIFSNKNFNSEYNSSINLAELFDVIVLYSKLGYHRYDLNEFIISEPKVPDTIILVLKSAPETTAPIKFTIQYFQDGKDMSSFEFTTVPLVITD